MDQLTMGIGLCAFVAFFLVLPKFKPSLVKVQQGKAIVISRAADIPGLGSKGVNVFFDNTYVIKAFDAWEYLDMTIKSIDVDCRGKDALLSRDKVPMDISATFHLRILRDEEAVLLVAETMGCEGASDMTKLNKLFGARFRDALRITCEAMDSNQLLNERHIFRSELFEVIGMDLSGYHFEDADIKLLEKSSFG